MNTTKLHLPFQHTSVQAAKPAEQTKLTAQPYYSEEDRDKLMAKFLLYTIIGIISLTGVILSLIILL